MTSTECRDAVKTRLGIKNSDFDTIITSLIPDAVRRLYPTAAKEVDSQESSVTVDSYGEGSVNLTTLSILAARQVEAYDGQTWYRVTKTLHHGSSLRLRGLDSRVTKVRVYGLNTFADITQVYDWLLQAVIWFVIAEFYDYLAGNQSRYNSYLQTTGARAVDNMRDESSYFEQKATNYLDEQSQAYGA